MKSNPFATVTPIEASSFSLPPGESIAYNSSGAGIGTHDQLNAGCMKGDHYLYDLGENPARWPLQSYPLAVFIDLDGLDESLASIQHALVGNAFEAWQATGNGVGYIRFVDAPGVADVHWRYVPLSRSRLAEASYWTNGGHFIVNAVVTLDPRMIRLDSRDGDLRMTLASATHEVGHILGINGNLNSRFAHPNSASDRDSIMFEPQFDRITNDRQVTKIDTNTLRMIYCMSQ